MTHNTAARTTRWLAIIVVLQALILICVWGTGGGVATARAEGIPDAGAQRDQMLDQLKATNEKLDKLFTLLSKGDLQVKLRKSDEDAKH